MSLQDDYVQLTEAVNEIAVYYPTRVEPKLCEFDLPAIYGILTVLEKLEIPAPQTFSHGPASVVLMWDGQVNRYSDKIRNLYFTLSKDQVSVLISSVKRILFRSSYPYMQFDSDLIKQIWKDFRYEYK